MPSSSKLIKQDRLSIRSEMEIPLKDHTELDSMIIGRQADSLLKIANAEASRVMDDVESIKKELMQDVLNEARAEAVALKKEGYDAGYEAGKIAGTALGYEEGLRESREKNRQIIEEAEEAYRQALSESGRIIEGVNSQIIELSIKIAEEIINKSIELDDKIIRGITEKVLNEVTHAKYISIKVNSNGKKQLEDQLPKLKERCPISLITLMADNTLRDGDCIVETESQIVEATIDAELSNIKAALCEVDQ